jgi:hypothetical protein
MATTRRTPLMWNDPALTGHRQAVEAAFADLGNVRSNAARSISAHQKTLDAAAAGKELKPKTVSDAQDNIALLNHMLANNVLVDSPMTLNNIAKHANATFGRAVGEARAIHEMTGVKVPPRGSAWYFNHHGELLAAQPDTGNPNISRERFALMAAAASPSNTPERERMVAASLSEMLHPERAHTVRLTPQGVQAVSQRLGTPTSLAPNVNHPVSGLSAAEIAAIASHAAEEHGAIKAGTLPSSSATVHSTGPIASSGLAAQRQVEVAAGLALGHEGVDPMSEYDPVSKPKTWAHGKMTGESIPGSAEHIDYMNIAMHHTYGDPNQGMLMFSQSAPAERASGIPNGTQLAWPLRQNVPVAADTWWRGISSGQPLKATRPVELTVRGSTVSKNQPYSPAKRVASDKKDPVAPEWTTKEAIGLPEDPTISREGLMHAYIDEGIRRAAASHGPISFNQFGENIHMPISLMHEVGWTQGRAEAGEDPDYNRDVREYVSEAKAEEKQRTAQQKFMEKVQLTLPGID